MTITNDQLAGLVARLAEDYGLVVDGRNERNALTDRDVVVYTATDAGVNVEVVALHRKVLVRHDVNLAELGSLFHSVSQHKRSLAKLAQAADRIDPED